MNREIKYRGMSITSNEWIQGDLIRNKESKCFIHFFDCNGFECLYEVYPESVGQYTGLDDKNGKEIYEGDIVNCAFGTIHTNNIVIFDEQSIAYCFKEDDGIICPIPNYKKYYKFEIIGNIYDNPELLE